MSTSRPRSAVRKRPCADIETMLQGGRGGEAAKARGEAAGRAEGRHRTINWVLVKNVSRLQGKQVPAAATTDLEGAVLKLPAYAGVRIAEQRRLCAVKIMAVKPLDKIDPTSAACCRHVAMAARKISPPILPGCVSAGRSSEQGAGRGEGSPSSAKTTADETKAQQSPERKRRPGSKGLAKLLSGGVTQQQSTPINANQRLRPAAGPRPSAVVFRPPST